MDITTEGRADWEKRRKIRLAQVRDQSKAIAKEIRDRVNGADDIQLEQHEAARKKTEQKFKSLALNKLKSDFKYLIQDVGNGYSVASVQEDPSITLAEKRLINRCKAISRGVEAEKRQKRVQEEQLIDKEMRERRTHFNKTVEKIRSTLISSVPHDDLHVNKNMQNKSKHNECFLISSQVTLSEANIAQNSNQKTSKPWSMVINSNENQMPDYRKFLKNDVNKENEQYVPKYTKLETDMKNYESLVAELNKLSANEQNIRKKLFTNNWEEVPVPCKKSVPLTRHKKYKHKEITRENHLNSDGVINQITEKQNNKCSSSLSTSLSSFTSTIINFEKPEESRKKHSHSNNGISEKSVIPSNSKLNCHKKIIPERPLKNINNMLQRIKNKKQLLVKEISADKKVDIKKSKTENSISKNAPLYIRCVAGDDLCKESPTNYAKLPDSFYNSQLETLKEQISKKKYKLNHRTNCNTSVNVDLMRYINILLKMTPSDVDNLSISSCSSVQLEESILQHPKNNKQYYCEMLNCISKCLNEDISDISQDTVFDSPKNINFLNRLQELTNYYLEKTHEMKNICGELPQILNEQKTEAEVIKENSFKNSSSDSFDGEYILGHLNTILQKKGLIKSDKEWPIFENNGDDDDNRSLTDQLLDVCSHRSANK